MNCNACALLADVILRGAFIKDNRSSTFALKASRDPLYGRVQYRSFITAAAAAAASLLFCKLQKVLSRFHERYSENDMLRYTTSVVCCPESVCNSNSSYHFLKWSTTVKYRFASPISFVVVQQASPPYGTVRSTRTSR